MTFASKVLEKLTSWRPGSGRQTLTIADAVPGWSISFTADRADELGCLVWDLTFIRADDTTVGLRDWADAIASRTTGLLDVLKVVEIDSERGEGFLRSVTPLQRGDKTLYHEVFLKGPREASVRRYQVPTNCVGKREQVAFPVTHEALAKLVGDVIG